MGSLGAPISWAKTGAYQPLGHVAELICFATSEAVAEAWLVYVSVFVITFMLSTTTSHQRR